MKQNFTGNIERLIARQRVATENYVTTLTEIAAHLRAAADDLSQEANRQIERCGFGDEAPVVGVKPEPDLNVVDPNFEIPAGIKPDVKRDVIEPIREHIRSKEAGQAAG